MYLVLNTAQIPFFYAFYEKDSCIVEYKFTEGKFNLENLGPKIQEQMDMLSIKMLKGILVVSGPGRFTSIRLGITVAKAFASVLDCPLIGIHSLKALLLSYPGTKETCLLALELKPKQFYMALGGGESPLLFSEPMLLEQEGLINLLEKSSDDMLLLSNKKIVLSQNDKGLIKQKQRVLPFSSFALAYYLDQSLQSKKKPEPVVPNYVFEP